MSKGTEFFKGTGGEVVRASGKAIKTCLFVAVAAVALGAGIGAVKGGFSN